MNALHQTKRKQALNFTFGPAKTPSAGLFEARKSEVHEDPSRSPGSGGLKMEEQSPKCGFAAEGREEPDFQSLSAI